jgi:hypothetical protein
MNLHRTGARLTSVFHYGSGDSRHSHVTAHPRRLHCFRYVIFPVICCVISAKCKCIFCRSVFPDPSVPDFPRSQKPNWSDTNKTAGKMGAHGSVVGWGTMLQAGRSRVRIPMRWIFFNWPNPSSRTMAPGSTQALTEMSTRKIPEG